MIEVTYKKKNGDVIKRYTNKLVPYRVGYKNAYGWEVVEVKHCYNGKYIPLEVYDHVRERDYMLGRLIAEMKKKIYKLVGNTGYIFFLFIFFRYFDEVIKKIV